MNPPLSSSRPKSPEVSIYCRYSRPPDPQPFMPPDGRYGTRAPCLEAPASSHRQRRDVVLLAHIRDQHRLSLGSYGRPRMTEELNELGVCVGQRRVGRLMRQNGIQVVQTRKFKATPTATTPSTSRRIFSSKTSPRAGRTRSGRVTSPMSGRRKVECILL